MKPGKQCDAMLSNESTYFLLLKLDFLHAQKSHTVEKKKGVFVDRSGSFTCRLIFFTSHHLASTSELLPSMIGLSAFLPGHYDLIQKLGRNQVCSSSLNQSAIPFQFFGFIFTWM